MVGEEIHRLTITEARSRRLRLPLMLSAQSTSTNLVANWRISSRSIAWAYNWAASVSNAST